MEADILELDYTKIKVIPIRKGSQDLRNATKTFGSRYGIFSIKRNQNNHYEKFIWFIQ